MEDRGVPRRRRVHAIDWLLLALVSSRSNGYVDVLTPAINLLPINTCGEDERRNDDNINVRHASGKIISYQYYRGRWHLIISSISTHLSRARLSADNWRRIPRTFHCAQNSLRWRHLQCTRERENARPWMLRHTYPVHRQIPKTNTITIISLASFFSPARTSMSPCSYQWLIHERILAWPSLSLSLGKSHRAMAAFTFQWMNVGFAPSVAQRKRHVKERKYTCPWLNARCIHIYLNSSNSIQN